MQTRTISCTSKIKLKTKREQTNEGDDREKIVFKYRINILFEILYYLKNVFTIFKIFNTYLKHFAMILFFV